MTPSARITLVSATESIVHLMAGVVTFAEITLDAAASDAIPGAAIRRALAIAAGDA